MKKINVSKWHGVCIASLSAAMAFYMATPVAIMILTAAVGAMSIVSGISNTAVVITIGAAAVPAVIIGVTAGGI